MSLGTSSALNRMLKNKVKQWLIIIIPGFIQVSTCTIQVLFKDPISALQQFFIIKLHIYMLPTALLGNKAVTKIVKPLSDRLPPQKGNAILYLFWSSSTRLSPTENSKLKYFLVLWVVFQYFPRQALFSRKTFIWCTFQAFANPKNPSLFKKASFYTVWEVKLAKYKPIWSLNFFFLKISFCFIWLLIKSADYFWKSSCTH